MSNNEPLTEERIRAAVEWVEEFKATPERREAAEKALKEIERSAINNLTSTEVSKLLESYESSGVTDQLYDMGKMLTEECGERIDALEGKAARVAGYAGAIIGLIVSTFPIWTSALDRWAIILVALGCLAGMIGGAVALRSMWPAPQLLPSDSDWLEEDALEDADRLKRYHVSSLHLTISSREKVAARKATSLKKAQICLAVMVLSLFVGLGNGVYKVATSSASSQPPSGDVVSMVF